MSPEFETNLVGPIARNSSWELPSKLRVSAIICEGRNVNLKDIPFRKNKTNKNNIKYIKTQIKRNRSPRNKSRTLVSLKALSPTTKHVQERYANKPSCLLHCRGITMNCDGVSDKLRGSRKKKNIFLFVKLSHRFINVSSLALNSTLCTPKSRHLSRKRKVF